MELQEIIKNFKKICGEEDLDVTDDCLFENALKLHISNNIGKQKNMYQNNEKINSEQDMKENEPITPKQKSFLEKVGKFKEGMTKHEAFEIIAEMSKKKKEY